MNQHSMQEASIPNPALKPLSILIGNWSTTGTHPMIPDTILHGRSSFEWLENGAFLMWRSEIDEPGVPSGIAIFGSDDSAEAFSMLYFDERGVSREFEATLHDNVWKMWRNVHGFSQRSTGTIVDGGNAIIWQSELSRDDATWQKDLELTFKRVT
jgi:hypothetical protein